MEAQRPEIGRRERTIGRAVNNLVARAPWLWPLLRGPVRRAFDERAGSWDQRASAGSAEYLTPLAKAVLHVKPAPERALDIGAGTGDGALFLAREFPHASVRGIDISEEMVNLAQGKIGLDPQGRVAFKVADASDLPFEDDSFDLVAQLNMPPFFAEIARVLRPGGFVVIAASWGKSTPFYTPDAVLRRSFRKRGIEPVEGGEAAKGTYFVARRPTRQPE
jgi:ubiquinone/menaquinone biosynthesis C-methylase UbiE